MNEKLGSASPNAKPDVTSITAKKEREVSALELAKDGIIVPLLDASTIAAAAKRKQEVITALLDPDHDILYTIKYQTADKKWREARTETKAEAERLAKEFKSRYEAQPKKTGVAKIAEAFGVDTEPVDEGWHQHPKSGQYYYYVKCRALHARSGRTRTAVGACDAGEKFDATAHTIISTAHTRAKIRAVLDLVGYGRVGAEEIEAGLSDLDEVRFSQDAREIHFPDAIPVSGEPIATAATKPRKVPAPHREEEEIIIANGAWAAAYAKSKDRPTDPSGKDALPIRALRAKARRGNVDAAKALGEGGYDWQGPAQDGDEPEWTVEPPLITADGEVLLDGKNDPPPKEGVMELSRLLFQFVGIDTSNATSPLTSEQLAGWKKQLSDEQLRRLKTYLKEETGFESIRDLKAGHVKLLIAKLFHALNAGDK